MIEKSRDDGTFHEASPMYNMFDITCLEKNCEIRALFYDAAVVLEVKTCWLRWFCGLSVVRNSEAV